MRPKLAKKVYISTPLSDNKFMLHLIQAEILRLKVFAFIPPTFKPNDQHQGSQVDKLSVELCDEMWVFGAIGRDCAWEIGYAQGLGIPVVFYKTEENVQVCEKDWMLFCAGTEVRDLQNLDLSETEGI